MAEKYIGLQDLHAQLDQILYQQAQQKKKMQDLSEDLYRVTLMVWGVLVGSVVLGVLVLLLVARV